MGKKIYKKQSFYDWCIENKHKELLKMWNYQLNDTDPKDVGHATNESFWFNCLIDIKHKPSLVKLVNLTNSKRNSRIICIECNSFGKWCTENNRIDLLNRWDYIKNNKTPYETSYMSHDKVWFKCDRNLHESKCVKIYSITKSTDSNVFCNKCNSFAQWGIDNLGEDFLEKYWDYEKNIINPWDISPNSHNKVWIKCQEKKYHGSYDVITSEFIRGSKCPYCCSARLHIFDSLGYVYNEQMIYWSDKNKKSPYEYTLHNNQKVWWKCPDGKHEDFINTVSDAVRRNFRCPKCIIERTESFLQEKVRLYIENKYSQYLLLHENYCSIIPINPKTKRNMPFDNEIYDLKLVIEVHGEQHYKISKFEIMTALKYDTTPEYEFKKRKLYDRYKKYIAWKRGYEYLEISYKTENNEKYKTLIDNKINEILDKLKIAS